MKPTKRHRHGQGCGNPDSIAPKKTVHYDHCCRLSCCGERLKPLLELVRNAEKEAGVDVGEREGLDFDPEAMKVNFGIRQEAMENLKAQQGIVLEALKSHLNVCAAVIWPGEEQTMGIVTPSRRDLQIKPLLDINQAEQRSKILIWFRHENRLRKIRNKIFEEQFLMDPSPGSQRGQVPETDDQQFKQQNAELMEILEKLDVELSSPNTSRRPGPQPGMHRTDSDLSQASSFFKGFELDDESTASASAAEDPYANKLFPFQHANVRYRSVSPAIQPEPEIPQPETEEERFARVLKESRDFDIKWGRA
jgi:hypothetical protein